MAVLDTAILFTHRAGAEKDARVTPAHDEVKGKGPRYHPTTSKCPSTGFWLLIERISWGQADMTQMASSFALSST